MRFLISKTSDIFCKSPSIAPKVHTHMHMASEENLRFCILSHNHHLLRCVLVALCVRLLATTHQLHNIWKLPLTWHTHGENKVSHLATHNPPVLSVIDEHEVDPSLEWVNLAREVVVLEITLLHRAQELRLNSKQDQNRCVSSFDKTSIRFPALEIIDQCRVGTGFVLFTAITNRRG